MGVIPLNIEAMDRSNGLVNGGVGSPGLLTLNGNDRGIRSAQPGNEACQLSDVDLCPAEMGILEVFPKLFEVMGCCADGIWAPVQVVQELEVSQNRLYWDKIIVKHQPGETIRLREAHSLYFHSLHLFRSGNGLFLPFYTEQPRGVFLHSLRCE